MTPPPKLLSDGTIVTSLSNMAACVSSARNVRYEVTIVTRISKVGRIK